MTSNLSRCVLYISACVQWTHDLRPVDAFFCCQVWPEFLDFLPVYVLLIACTCSCIVLFLISFGMLAVALLVFTGGSFLWIDLLACVKRYVSGCFRILGISCSGSHTSESVRHEKFRACLI
jgi:hypothetical protein